MSYSPRTYWTKTVDRIVNIQWINWKKPRRNQSATFAQSFTAKRMKRYLFISFGNYTSFGRHSCCSRQFGTTRIVLNKQPTRIKTFVNMIWSVIRLFTLSNKCQLSGISIARRKTSNQPIITVSRKLADDCRICDELVELWIEITTTK